MTDPMRRTRRLAALVAVAALVVGCDDDTVTDDPIAGTATVQLELDAGSDAAGIRLRLDGDGIQGITPARDDYQVFIGESSASGAEVIVLGALRSGPLLHVELTDAAAAGRYDADVLELSDSGGVVLPDGDASLDWLAPVAR